MLIRTAPIVLRSVTNRNLCLCATGMYTKMLTIPLIILLIHCTSHIFFRNTFVNGFDTSFVTRSNYVFKQWNNNCNVVPFYLSEFKEAESLTCKLHSQNITQVDQIRSNKKILKNDLKIKFQSYFDTWKNYHLIFMPQENVAEKCMSDIASLISSVENMELWALKSKLNIVVCSY